MQKLIAKYGAAAHLALLAAAPLFLFPFCSDGTIATVLLWLSFPAAVWAVMEPSVHDGEMLHGARVRTFRAMVSDPLLWICLALVVCVGVRAYNIGIGLTYDSESAAWSIADARFPLFPGSVGLTGYLPFAAAVAATVIVQGCRHSLGRSARMAFLFVSSALAGLAAAVVIFMAAGGNAAALATLSTDTPTFSSAGLAFALHLLCGVTALVAAFERKWRLAMPIFAFSVGGTAAGAFVFSPPLVSFAGGCAAILLIVYAFIYTCRSLRASGEFKFLVVCGISLTLGGLLVVAFLSDKMLSERLSPYLAFSFLSNRFNELRSLLDGVALKTWLAHLWIGTGIGSFQLDFRFAAKPDDWALVRNGVVAVPNGWLMLLVERGLVGAVSMALPIILLLFSFGRRVVDGYHARMLPHPACLLTPLVLGVAGTAGVFDCSVLRADVLLVALSSLAVSANSFLRKRGQGNGK